VQTGRSIKTSNHVGTHIDGQIHFFGSGKTIGQVPIKDWIGQGVVVDISDEVEDYSLYSPEMLMSKAESQKRVIFSSSIQDTTDIAGINRSLMKYAIL